MDKPSIKKDEQSRFVYQTNMYSDECFPCTAEVFDRLVDSPEVAWKISTRQAVEKAINERLDVVDTFFRDPDFRSLVDEQLQRVGDLERIIAKASVGRISPREMLQLKVALEAVAAI